MLTMAARQKTAMSLQMSFVQSFVRGPSTTLKFKPKKLKCRVAYSDRREYMHTACLSLALALAAGALHKGEALVPPMPRMIALAARQTNVQVSNGSCFFLVITQ
jgi:hypothetical protein